MGYQESYIFTTCSNVEKNNSDVEEILKIFKKYGVRCVDDDAAECRLKLHFNKDVSGISGWGGMGSMVRFRKGMEMLVVAGERSAQRNAMRLFATADFKFPDMTEEEWELLRRVKICFIDNFEFVYEAEKTDKITVEKIELHPDGVVESDGWRDIP